MIVVISIVILYSLVEGFVGGWCVSFWTGLIPSEQFLEGKEINDIVYVSKFFIHSNKKI